MLNESGQFRRQSGHARTSAEQKNICRFLVSGAAAAEVNVDKSGQFFPGCVGDGLVTISWIFRTFPMILSKSHRSSIFKFTKKCKML